VNQELFDWILLIARWVHITVAVTWIGTSIFFMWLDRSFVRNPDAKNEGHVGEVWMVHGGGFYHVEKLLMGPTKVPEHLHWFKWESYWTWLSGLFLVIAIFYTGGGTFLLDPEVSDITYWPAVGVGLFSLIGSWFYYDFLWERKLTRDKPIVGHVLTLAWFVGMTYYLCHTFSGRAAYIHIGGMLGTWMTANVFMRIIPRQVKMVEASKKGEEVNQEWGKNAKNRSTHNTYFTLPVIFIMLSNHFPATYGHELNWLILFLLSGAGAAIRQYFIIRLSNPSRSKMFLVLGLVLLLVGALTSREQGSVEEVVEAPKVEDHSHLGHDHGMKEEPEVVATPEPAAEEEVPAVNTDTPKFNVNVNGKVFFKGKAPLGKKLRLPGVCAKKHKGTPRSDEVIVTNGMLANVLIRVTKGLEGKEFKDVPAKEIEMDQSGCIYKPRVVAARVGQKVTFINSDRIFHNVRTTSENNKKFNANMPRKGQRVTKTFNKEEIFVQTKCSVHPWMKGYVGIVAHPFFDVTERDGAFALKDLPAGKYTVEAWHEVYGTVEKEIEITEEKDLKLEFTFEAKE
jgi:uncharacterized membrane protein/plastocyanin